jgi:cytochrome P450
MAALVAAVRDHGDVVRFAFGPVDMVLVAHPNDVRRVFVENAAGYDKTVVGYAKLRLALGDGLLTSDGETWRRKRRVVQPAFHHGAIARLGTVIVAAARKTAARLCAREGSIDVAAEMTALTLDIICQAMFSMDIAAESELLGRLMVTSIEHVNRRMLALSSIFDFPDRLPTPANRRFTDAIRTGDALVADAIARRRAMTAPPDDLLSLLMSMRDPETGAPMSDRELRDEIITIFAAGHETTANVLAWTWHLLAENPECRDALDEELARVLGGRPPESSDVRALETTAAIVKEAMRLYPPAWVMSRRAVESDCLGGFDVPAGTAVLLSPYVTHRHPSLWPDAARFDPTRFLGDRAASIPKYAYFPFGGGQRLCIGKEMAMMEAILVVATIAQHCRFGSRSDHVVAPEALVTLRPRGGLPMIVEAHRAGPRKLATSIPCVSIQR